METTKNRPSWQRRLRDQFLLGLVVAAPIGATILVLILVFEQVDGFLQPIVKLAFGRPIPGVGFGVTVLLIYLIGVVASNIVGKALIRSSESLLNRVPFVRAIYNTIREITQSFSSSRKGRFLEVVLIEYPRKGLMALSFVTNEFKDQDGVQMLAVLVPHSPNPVTGSLQILRADQVTHTRITVDEAIRMIVSAGSASPDQFGEKAQFNITEEA